MKIMKVSAMTFCLLLVLSCGEDDEKFASIVGNWRGTLAEVEVKPLGLPLPFSRSDDNFSAEMEFRADGTIILLQGSQPTVGTYQLKDDKLVTDIGFDTDLIDLTGTYTIEALTQTQLVFYLKKSDTTLTDPDSGHSISGDIKATLYFERI